MCYIYQAERHPVQMFCPSSCDVVCPSLRFWALEWSILVDTLKNWTESHKSLGNLKFRFIKDSYLSEGVSCFLVNGRGWKSGDMGSVSSHAVKRLILGKLLCALDSPCIREESIASYLWKLLLRFLMKEVVKIMSIIVSTSSGFTMAVATRRSCTR